MNEECKIKRESYKYSTVIYLHATTIDYKHKIKIDDYMVLSFKKYIKTFNFNISNKILL